MSFGLGAHYDITLEPVVLTAGLTFGCLTIGADVTRSGAVTTDIGRTRERQSCIRRMRNTQRYAMPFAYDAVLGLSCAACVVGPLTAFTGSTRNGVTTAVVRRLREDVPRLALMAGVAWQAGTSARESARLCSRPPRGRAASPWRRRST